MMALPTTSLTLHFTPPRLFCDYQFVALNPPVLFSRPPNPTLPGDHPNVLGFYSACSLTLFLNVHIQGKSYGVCLSLSDVLNSAKCPLGPSMLWQMQDFILFDDGVTFHRVHVPLFLAHPPPDGHLVASVLGYCK